MGRGRDRVARELLAQTTNAPPWRVTPTCPNAVQRCTPDSRCCGEGIMFSGYDGEVQIVHYASGVGTRDATSGCGMT